MSHELLLQVCLFLLLSVVFVPLSKKIGLGSVIGYLAAGLLVGPHGFWLVTGVQDVQHFSEMGVVILLFLIGLELDPQKLWRLRAAIFGLGTLQIVFTTLAFCGLVFLWNQNFHTSLIAALGFSLSSTAIGLQILKEKNLLSRESGQNSFSVLLFQDLAVIPMLILIPLLSPLQNTKLEPFYFILARLALAVFVVFLLGRFILKPVFRFVAHSRLREVFTAFSLLIVLGISLMMDSLGLSMPLGTFLAGVLLANSEYRHELEIDLEPFKGLLVGLFFVSVGMEINLERVVENPVLILVSVFALVGVKLLILYFLARRFKMDVKESMIFSIALSQGGEFAFVLFSTSQRLEILAGPMVVDLNLILALSMVTTPILFTCFEKIFYRLEKSEKKEFDQIQESHPVIVAGFGRVGQMVNRLLRAKGISSTVIDLDPNQIDLVTRFGFKAYYGDVTRFDLLESAGLHQARLLILAVDDAQASLKVVEYCQRLYPNLKILARVRNRVEAYQLINKGIEVHRETFGTAMDMAYSCLVHLGFSAADSLRSVEKFEKYDIINKCVR